MNENKLLLCAAAVAIALHGAWADTIFFKDGSSLDGKVLQPNPNVYVLQLEKGRMYFQASRVDHWEKNEKKGRYNAFLVNPHQTAHEEARQEKTGLTGEQIDAMYRMMEPLSSSDPNEVKRAQEALLAKNDSVDVFKFLKAAMIDMSDKYLPATLEVMVKLNPKATERILVKRATDPFTPNRTKALELIGKTDAAKHVGTLARGMLDPNARVQTTAARALAQSGDKGCTPALLQGLKSGDMRVRKASEEALQSLWGDNRAHTPAAWDQLWRKEQSNVHGVVTVASLKPLVSKEAVDHGHQHDE